jgi:hypothetical protein
MLCAVSTLGEVLITTNVSTLASFTTLTRLSVTAARRSTARASHFEVRLKKKRIRQKTTRLERVKAVDEASDLIGAPTSLLGEVGCRSDRPDQAGTRNLMRPDAAVYM